MNPSKKEILRNAFKDVIVATEFNESKIALYFDKNYYQWVDGHELDYQGFVDHMKAQKQRIDTASVTFKSLIEEDNIVASIHLIDAVTKDGNQVKGKVVAQFTFKDEKLIRCEELTFFDKAKEEDRDLGHVK